MERRLAVGQRVFWAAVIACTKGSPGTPGAQLLLTDNGQQIGTIGGGALEQKILQQGRDLLAASTALPQLLTLEHFKSGESPSGLICGGTQTQVLCVLEPEPHLPLVRSVIAQWDTDPCQALQICHEGLSLTRLTAPPAHSHKLERTADAWSAHLQLFNRRRVAIWGGGHCGVALARQMQLLGYSVTLLEWRKEIYTLQDFAYGQLKWVTDFAMSGNDVNYPEMTFAIVMTHDYPNDVRALMGALPLPFPFIGVMGSLRKLKAIREALSHEGFDQNDLDRITAPVGLPFDSNTPEEIAVSVSAQILIQRETLGLQ